MRMVFTAAPEDVFYPAQERIVAAAARWARKQRRDLDPFVIAALIEHRWADGDGVLCRWRPAELREALCTWFPRQVTLRAEDSALLLASIRTFIDFLFAADLADSRCAELTVLHALIDACADEVVTAMGDERRYGPAKFWAMRMLAAGIDVEDPRQTRQYLQDAHAEPHLLNHVMANQVPAANTMQLPPVDVPAGAELGDLAYSVACEAAFIDTEGPDARLMHRASQTDLDRLLEQLALLGTVKLDRPDVSLTRLGVALFATHLRQRGVTVPTLADIRTETAEVLINHVDTAPPAARAALVDQWRQANPDNGTDQLLALAARTDDPWHRDLAQTYAGPAHQAAGATVRRIGERRTQRPNRRGTR